MALFQATGLEKSEMIRLVKTINKASSDEALEESRLERAFDGLWDQFTHGIRAVPESAPESKQEPAESTNPVLEEILVLSRQQTQMLASSESVSPVVHQINEQIEEIRHLLSVSALLDADQGVWYDLSRTWTRFLNTWEGFTVSLKPEGEGLGATGMIRGREEDWRLLLDSIAELRRPIEFLTGRRTQRPPRSTSDRAWARLLNTTRAPYTVRWIPQGETESAGLQLPDLRSALDFACSIRKATATLPFADYWVEDISGLRVADKRRIEEHCLQHGLV